MCWWELWVGSGRSDLLLLLCWLVINVLVALHSHIFIGKKGHHKIHEKCIHLTWNMIGTWVKWRTNLRFLKTSITFLKLNCQLSSHIYIAQNHKVIHLPQMALKYHKISLYPSLDRKCFHKIKTGEMVRKYIKGNSGGICNSKMIYRLMASAYPYTPHPVLCGRCVWVCYIPQAFFSPINTQEKKGNILPTVHPLKD